MGKCVCTKKDDTQSEDNGVHLGNETESHQNQNESDSPKDIKKHKLHSMKTTFLDLPPELMEKILTYLPATEVYCNVRNVCHRLLDIVDGYIQAGKHTKQNIA